MARRLAHYEGAMRHIATLEAQQHQLVSDQQTPTSGTVQQVEPQQGNDDEIAANVDLMAIHPVWGSVGSYSKAPVQQDT